MACLVLSENLSWSSNLNMVKKVEVYNLLKDLFEVSKTILPILSEMVK